MNPVAARQEPLIELRPWQHGVIFLLACAVVISRRPDAILHAQFWTEDGHVFFADAYNLGWWASLLRTYQGYLHVFPRLGASLALIVPLSLAPLVLNFIAIGIQALPTNLLLSFRSSAWGSLRFRTLLAAMYLALPNTREMSNGIAQSQWHLALCAFLLLAACAPRHVAGRLFDLSVLLLCGLTGPFCIFLFPVALFLVWKQREPWRWAEASVLAGTCLVQAWGLFSGGFSGRPHYVLGASPALFTRILGGQIFSATLLGGNGLAAHASPALLISLLCLAMGGVAIVSICFANSSLVMKLFLLFSSMLFAASIVSPAAYPPAGVSIWELLVEAEGVRYWYFPTIAFAWSILWCLRSKAALLKTVSAVLLCLMCFGIVRDWRHPAYEDMHFAEYAKRVEAAPAGTVVTIPENPEGWNLQLVKHFSGR
ncbi:MAG: hypothetical protein P4K94_05640 [Terracidiphilus sp.]|nr:hypothetical protein [Terracidiphilus sp.]